MADLELSDFVIFQHILQLVSRQRPDAIGILLRVFCDDLGVQLIELNEVRVPEAEITEQFDAFELLISHEQYLSHFLSGHLCKLCRTSASHTLQA